MKIVLLNTYDYSGGASRACVRLLSGLSDAGIDATMLVRETSRSRSGVRAVAPRFGGFLRALIDAIPLRWYPHRQLHVFAPAWVPGKGISQASRLAPDLVHLHWIVNGFVRIEDISSFNRPVVWTLHDSWPFTGGCHLPADCIRYEQTCGHCPVLGSNKENDLSQNIWKRKQKAWENLSLTIVAPSRWIADKAKSSSLFRDIEVEVIPNGIDTALYCPGDKMQARKLLGLPTSRNLILFGAVHAISDLNKGLDLLLGAIDSLDCSQLQNTELVLFGVSDGESVPECKIPVRKFGVITDEEQMVLLYRAADLFVAPSRQENFPYVIMEAMSCGTPCVAFAAGGIPDLIEHGETGYLAKPYLIEDLAAGIINLLNDDALRGAMAVKSRKWIECNLSLDLIVQRHLKLYRQLLSGSVID